MIDWVNKEQPNSLLLKKLKGHATATTTGKP